MNEARPYASLSSGLLARKGTAKPAMRPQGFGGLEDLGWNDMGHGPGEERRPAVPDHVPSSIAALTPAPKIQRTHPGDGPSAADAEEQDAFDPAAPFGEAEPEAPLHEAEADQPFAEAEEAEQSYEAEEAEQSCEAEAACEPAETWEAPEAEAWEAPEAEAGEELAASQDPVEPEAAADEAVAPFEAPSVVAQQRAILERFDGEEEFEAAAAPAAPRDVRSEVVPLPQRPAVDDHRKAAFTLRLDSERHLRLRLACAVSGRSAQQIVARALDEALAGLPEIEALDSQVPAKPGRAGKLKRS